MDITYLDNNATTAIAPEVREAMAPYLEEFYGNPSSSHGFGFRVRKAIEEARAEVAGLLGAEPDEIIFTGSGTESDNTAIMSAVETTGKGHVISTVVEHPAVLNPIKRLIERGLRASVIGVDSNGSLDMDGLLNSVNSAGSDTALASVMYANNETGVVFPIDKLALSLREKGILFHTDAVQAAGKVAIDVKKTLVDFLSISGHKLHAPKGVGALYVRRGTAFRPYILGGHQEKGRRAGTENVASIIGLGAACKLAKDRLEMDGAYIKKLKDTLEAELLKRCPDSRVNGGPDGGGKRLPNTVNMSFAHVDGEAILLKLDGMGICVSTGSACASGSVEPSHVLRAMSVPQEYINGSIRFSLSRYNTPEEIDKAIGLLPGIIKQLREISPFGRPGQ